MAKNELLIPINLDNMRIFMSALTAIQKACPFCGAKPQRGCTTFGGKKRKTFHQQRLRSK